MKRPIVCGGRAFRDRDFVYATLDRLNHEDGFDDIIQGGASGADALARDWAASRLVCYLNFAADWKKHGLVAGPIRNQRMIDEGRPDGCIAFPGGTGTADMVRRARAAGLPVIEVSP